MKTSTITKTLGVLALLGSSAGMAATVTITPSSAIVAPGDTFTMTITANVPNTFAATMALAFDATRVAYVSGVALSPWNVFTKNSPVTANPTVFDLETPAATAANPSVYDVARLTFTVLAGAQTGSAGIVINDDGGNATGWFDADTADYIPNSYTQGNVQVQAAVVPAPATLGLLATGLAGLALRARRKRAA
jgi:hypothetical protein